MIELILSCTGVHSGVCESQPLPKHKVDIFIILVAIVIIIITILVAIAVIIIVIVHIGLLPCDRPMYSSAGFS